MCAEGKPKTRGCGTGAGIYEQAGTRARTEERAEGAGGKLVWGCFAFLLGLEHVNATPSSRKISFVDINRRYVRSVGRLTSFWKIWPGKMPAEARANGFLRTRGLTYRRFLPTALCFSRRRVVEGQWEKGGLGSGASSIRGIAPGSWRDSLRDTDRAISRRAARVAFGEYVWGKETPRSSSIPGSRGARRQDRRSAWRHL